MNKFASILLVIVLVLCMLTVVLLFRSGVFGTIAANPHDEPTEDTATSSELMKGDGNLTFVYVTNSGIYYHSVLDCGGLQNTNKVTLDLALARKLTACPDCARGFNNNVTEIAATFYTTANGKWYHNDPTCQGMNGASIVTESNAIVAGKTACPVCVGYYGTPGGKYYHSISNCSGMQNAVTKPKDEWIKAGKSACPTCMGSNENANRSKIPNETRVYYTTGGSYYHAKGTCSGMKNAIVGSISSAEKLGKKVCTSCVTKANIYVFSAANGKYYHTQSNCNGMKNTSYITAKTAVSRGKTACPDCAWMLASNISGN